MRERQTNVLQSGVLLMRSALTTATVAKLVCRGLKWCLERVSRTPVSIRILTCESRLIDPSAVLCSEEVPHLHMHKSRHPIEGRSMWSIDFYSVIISLTDVTLSVGHGSVQIAV